MAIEFSRLGSFIATDSALKFYEIVIMQERSDGEHRCAFSRQYLQTVDGKAVTRKNKGRYLLADSGLPLRSYDPMCP
jgi:hypothetical protein